MYLLYLTGWVRRIVKLFDVCPGPQALRGEQIHRIAHGYGTRKHLLSKFVTTRGGFDAARAANKAKRRRKPAFCLKLNAQLKLDALPKLTPTAPT